jgi:hypothetical protein
MQSDGVATTRCLATVAQFSTRDAKFKRVVDTRVRRQKIFTTQSKIDRSCGLVRLCSVVCLHQRSVLEGF